MNRMLIALLTIVMLAAASTAQAACRHAWVIGVYDPPPFQSFAPDGTPTGVEVDLIRQVATQMQCPVTFKNIPWLRQLNYAKSGDVDIVMGAGIRADRKQYLYFFSPYIYEPSVFVMLAQQRAQMPINSLQDVTRANEDFKVAALLGASYSQAYADWIKDPQSMRHMNLVDTNETTMKLLLARHVAAALFSDPHEPFQVLHQMNLKADLVVFPIDIEGKEDNYAYFAYSKKRFTIDDARTINDRLVATVKSADFSSDLRKYFSDSEIKVLLSR